MTEFQPGSPYLEGLRHIKLPSNEDSAVRVVVRYFADRGFVCADKARRIVREGTMTSD